MSLRLITIACLLSLAACSDDTTSNQDGAVPDAGVKDAALEASKPDAKQCAGYPDAGNAGACVKNTQEVFKGQYTVVMNKIEMAGLGEGFDLNNDDCDNNPLTGTIDNILYLIGSLANSALEESMQKGEVNIPFEFYDLDDTTTDTCFNYSIYVGLYPPDYDADGDEAGGPTSKPGKDCNDNDAKISSKATEVAGNSVDDDCDGLADESGATPSTDTTDADKDGQTIKDGDCDDRADDAAKMIFGSKIKKGATEICGDGLDNDCDGQADEACMPWHPGSMVPVESAGLDTAGKESLIKFKGATLKSGKLLAGPSLFGVKLKIASSATLDFNLTHVFMSADVTKDSKGLNLAKGLLGGVLGARAMDLAPNFAEQVGIGTKDDSLLDAVLGPAKVILGLPKDKDGNAVPDIDVDGDGIEKFLDKDLDGDTYTFRVDTCIDGDGTVVKDTIDPTTKKVLTSCTAAKDSNGNYRFKDGWSVAFKFTSVPGKILGIHKTK